MTPATIIIVEDEMIVALDIQNRLQFAGYNVPAVAISGSEAVELAKQFRPDLMLMDIGLQGPVDGINAAQQIRSSMDVPVIFLTAYGDTKSRKRAKDIGASGFLVKPFEDSELLSAIKSSLRLTK